MRCLALEYHDIVRGDPDASGFPGGAAASYKVDRALFEAHLDAIHRARVTIVSAADLSGAPGGLPVLFTFDDGGVAAVSETAPALARFGWPGHFFITTGRIGTPGFLRGPEILAMEAAGHVIGSHSVTHPVRFSGLTRSAMLREWRESRDTLSQLLGREVRTASVPGGYFSRAVAETAAEAGFTFLFTSEPTTRIVSVDGCTVIGRFTLRRGSGPAAVKALAVGAPAALAREWGLWNFKKVAKAAALRPYLALRQWLLDR
jgi:peptidoglycan/xylan/chitin deacetylase (PgdA/CDA1 family)